MGPGLYGPSKVPSISRACHKSPLTDWFLCSNWQACSKLDIVAHVRLNCHSGGQHCAPAPAWSHGWLSPPWRCTRRSGRLLCRRRRWVDGSHRTTRLGSLLVLRRTPFPALAEVVGCAVVHDPRRRSSSWWSQQFGITQEVCDESLRLQVRHGAPREQSKS